MLGILRNSLPLSVQMRLLKAWLRVERHFPMAVRSVIWNDLSPFGKPQLGYLETHLVNHCNLNCRRCSHFAPLAPPHFEDPDVFERDMLRLGELFRNIRVIRLMGGEPLLHPAVERFLSIAREAFPAARIHLVTNGLLIRQMRDTFWQACRDNRVTIDLTVYPPVRALLDDIRELCLKEQVTLRESPNNTFCVRMNFKGNSPGDQSFSNCRSLFFCPNLRNGRLYVCATSTYIGLFNARYGEHLPQDQGIALDDPQLSGRSVLRALNRPVELCRFCSLKTVTVPWSNGRPEKSDWDIHSASGSGG